MYELDLTYARAEQAYRSAKIREGIVGRRDRVRARRLTRTAVTAALTAR